MQRPRVSIGLPVYNGQRYLEGALRALLGQTYSDFELIISDNASTDRTAQICQDFAGSDSRIRYRRNETNVGANPNFNRVLDMARGEYFRWAAYDDVCEPTCLAECVSALDADRSAVLAHPQTAIIDEFGRPMKTAPDRTTLSEINDPRRMLWHPSPVTRLGEILLHTKWCFEIFAVIRTHILRETGGHGDFYGSDKVILTYLALQGPFLEVPKSLFLRRYHPQQSSLISSASAREAWSGATHRRRLLGSRGACLSGYWSAVRHSRLTLGQRLGCYAVLARYIGQWHKWLTILGLDRRRRMELQADFTHVGASSVR